jgi:HK97 family phage prohead protease
MMIDTVIGVFFLEVKYLEYKDLKLDVKGLNELGELEGYAAYKGNIDSYGDILEHGSMKRTIRNNKSFPLLWGHDPNQPIGLTTVLKEDDRGLYMKAQLDLENDLARRVYSGVKNGYISGLSIGYRVVKDDVNKRGNRLLKEIKLYEISLITKGFAANDMAMVSGFKSLGNFDSLLNRIKQLEDQRFKSGEGEDDPPMDMDVLKRIADLEEEVKYLKELADSSEDTRPFLMPSDPDESTLEQKEAPAEEAKQTSVESETKSDADAIHVLNDFKKYLRGDK